MPELLAALDAFVQQESRRGRELSNKL